MSVAGARSTSSVLSTFPRQVQMVFLVGHHDFPQQLDMSLITYKVSLIKHRVYFNNQCALQLLYGLYNPILTVNFLTVDGRRR